VALVAAFLLSLWLIVARTVSIRKTHWIAAQPKVHTTLVDELPPAIRHQMIELAHPLAAAGFDQVSVVHAAEFSSFGSWSQVLFVNRTEGDRVSILGLVDGEGESFFDVIAATEFRSGRTVLTRASEIGALPSSKATSPQFIDLSQLLALHRSRSPENHAADAVGRTSGEDDTRVLPATGEELTWLQQRAVIVAGDTAQKLRYRLDRAGQCYRPTWWQAYCMAMNARSRSTGRGFAVIPINAPPSTPPPAPAPATPAPPRTP
jgi:hypothetical protein